MSSPGMGIRSEPGSFSLALHVFSHDGLNTANEGSDFAEPKIYNPSLHMLPKLAHDGLKTANEDSDFAGRKTHNTAIHVLTNNIPENSTHSIESALFQLGMLQLSF